MSTRSVSRSRTWVKVASLIFQGIDTTATAGLGRALSTDTSMPLLKP